MNKRTSVCTSPNLEWVFSYEKARASLSIHTAGVMIEAIPHDVILIESSIEDTQEEKRGRLYKVTGGKVHPPF